MPGIRKTFTKAEMLASLSSGEILFPPLSLASRPKNEWMTSSATLPPRERRVNNSDQEFQKRGQAEAAALDKRVDAVLEISWNERSYLFAVECKASATPAILEEAVQQIRRASRPPLLWPMVFVPYLSDAHLQRLEREGVSGLDMCGNGVVIVPGELLAYRTGKPNLYPQSFPIKNVFRGTSALIARAFLLRPSYKAVGEIRDEIQRRGGTVAFSTVSKALARLEEELIVGRQSGEIRLLQADKLLQRLVENYRPPQVTRRFIGTTSIRPESLLDAQLDWAKKSGVSIALTGVSSVRLYAAMPREEIISVYCSDMGRLLERLAADVQEQNRFAKLELLETNDDAVYFDPRVIGRCPWASVLQTYLELATGGKREQETAEQIKLVIWRDLTKPGAG
jgi:hypothetical protein